MKALKIAASGMAAQQMRVDVISNNIANMSTTAYQPRVAEFADLHYEQYLPPGALSSESGTIVPAGIQLGHGVRPSTVSMELVQGALRQTGGDLDIGIEGRGYFQVELPSGDTAYTRDGKFNRTADGQMVTPDGYALSDNVVIPADARRITISADGIVTAFFDGVAQGQQIGTISLAVFANAKGLEAIGSNMFMETEASGTPVIGVPGEDGTGFMRQGFLEESGVDVVEEISELIEAQRGYELNSKVITAADEMLSATTRIR